MSFRVTSTSAMEGRSLDYRRALYEARTEDADIPLSDEEIKRIRLEAWHAIGETGGKVRYSLAEVRRWLENPDLWSPFVDWIAIERALDFDWPVIESLTHLEYAIFIERIINLYDPLSQGYEFKTNTQARVHENQQSVLPRRQRYLAGTDDQRNRLNKAMDWQRRKMAKLEAA